MIWRTAIVLGAWLLTGAVAPGIAVVQDERQDEVTKDKVTKAELEALRKKIDDPKTPIETRAAILRDFVAKAEKRTLSTQDRKKLWIQLATFELAVRKPWEAMRLYKRVKDLCKPGRVDLYFRATCSLGIARCHEMLNDEAQAVAVYSSIEEGKDFLGLPQVRLAKAALERLRAKQRVTIGRGITFPKKSISVLNRPVRAASGREATLLLFVPALVAKETPKLPRRLRGIDTRWPLRLIVSAPFADARRWHKALRAGPWGKRAITLRNRLDRFYGVASLPSWLLLDADGVILEINPSRRRLAAIFDR